MLEIIAGAKEFKLGYSGSSMSVEDMQHNIKVGQLVSPKT